MKKAICFIFDKNYLKQGAHAILSAKVHNPEYTTILLIDDPLCTNIADIILTPKNIGINLENWLIIGRIAIVEYVLKELNFDTAIFIDSDTYTYDNYDILQEEVANHSLVVIPHITKPFPNDNAQPAHNTLSLAGNYNSGVWGSSKLGLDFISWWRQQTTLYPIMNPCGGFFNEQGWLRFALDFDESAKIFRHPGYNVAYWNIKQRHLEINNGKWYIDGEKLCVVHFSGLNPGINPKKMSIFQDRYILDENEPTYMLYNSYYNLIWS